MTLFGFAALLPLRLQAQALPLLSPTSYALPAGHSFILGITPTSNAEYYSYSLFNLDTTAEIWGATSADSTAWQKVGQWGGFLVDTQGLVMADPNGQQVFVTGRAAMASNYLYGYNLGNGTVTTMLLTNFPPGPAPVGLTVAPDRKFYASSASAIYVYPDLTTGTATTVISNFGAQALGSAGAKLSFANATLYAFDTANSRVLRYDADGNFLSEFAVAGGSAFTVSDSGLLFTSGFEDSAGNLGTIYRADTGEVVGHFDVPYDIDDPSSNGGRSALRVINDQLLATSGSGANLYGYDLFELEPADSISTGGTAVFATNLVSTPSLRITDTGGSLGLSGDSTVHGGYLQVDDGVAVTLAPHATLNAGVVRLEGSAQLSLQAGSELTVNQIKGGALTLDGGLVRAKRNQADFVTSALTLGSGGGSFDTAGFHLEISGTIAGSGGLTKLGAGTLLLSGANTYTGATAISAGTLILAANSSLTHSPTITVAGGATFDVSRVSQFTLASGQTLTGEGAIAGWLTVGAGAHLAPGNGPDTLTFNNSLSLDGGAILDFQLGDPLDSTISRHIDVGNSTGGSLRGPTTGLVTINLADAGGFGAGTYDLIRYTSATFVYTDSFIAENFTLGTEIAGYTYTFAVANNALQLNVTAVPEPATWAAVAGVAALALAAWRRRR